MSQRALRVADHLGVAVGDDGGLVGGLNHGR